MSVSITNNLNYTLKPTSVACQRKQLVIPSSNKTEFSPSDTAVFYLPSLRNNVMDGQSGYLRFTAEITGDGLIDHSAHCFINRIQTYGSGGQLISDIQGYNVMAILMTDLQMDQANKIGLSPILGCADAYDTAATALTYTAITAKDAFAALPAAQAAAGDAFTTLTATTTLTNSNRKGMALVNGLSYTFCIPLIHPLFTLSEKYFPSYALSDDIRIEITFETAIQALVSSTAFLVKNPEIIVDYLQFDEQVFGLIKETYAGRDLIIPAQDYHFYASSIASTTGNISQIIPAKMKSARAFFFSFRPAETQVTGSYTLSSRLNPFFTAGDQFNLNIGGQRVPQKPITTRVTSNFAEWFASTQGALHAFNALEMNGSIPRSYYNVAPIAGSAVTTSAYKNGFALGLNLDQLRGQNQTQNSGLSLANVTTYYEGTIATAALKTGGAAQSITVDAYLLHDVLYIIGADGNMAVTW